MEKNHNQIPQGSDEHSVRLEKLKELQDSGINPWPEGMQVTATAQEIIERFKKDQQPQEYAIAGRIMTKREHGKTIFATVQDRSGHIQIYLRQDVLGDSFEQFKNFMDIGDIIWSHGTVFLTKTEEITLKVDRFQLLSKSLYPLPEKFHGLTDVETKYRQRYLDLITNPESRERFIVRSLIIRTIRQFLDEQGFIEVETPMLHPIPGGAEAKPFVTHHNALDMELYLRIAPELYLKRLIIGGYERVYEINRCFRNEGISTKHNPEFTTVELYVAYHDYIWMMDFAEQLIKKIVATVCNAMDVTYGNAVIHFGKPFKRLTMYDAVRTYTDCTEGELTAQHIDNAIKRHNLKIEKNNASFGEKLYLLFDKLVEHQLIQPTFITQFPIEVSPLAKRNPENPEFADRFELFIAGMEISNAFNELNDPFDQAERFRQQAASREAGNEEAHYYDADYIRALEYGLPPTVGFGMGIDRLAMLLTNTQSIRDVILFPTLKKK